jgi:hypothetical protein
MLGNPCAMASAQILTGKPRSFIRTAIYKYGDKESIEDLEARRKQGDGVYEAMAKALGCQFAVYVYMSPTMRTRVGYYGLDTRGIKTYELQFKPAGLDYTQINQLDRNPLIWGGFYEPIHEKYTGKTVPLPWRWA